MKDANDAQNERIAAPLDHLLLPDEVAEMLRIHKKSLLRMCKRMEIPHVRVGKFVRFHRKMIENWVGQQS